jgi:hypothetical protein
MGNSLSVKNGMLPLVVKSQVNVVNRRASALLIVSLRHRGYCWRIQFQLCKIFKFIWVK